WDNQMIGNREITDKTRRSYWERFTMENGNLPVTVAKHLTKIQLLNLNSGVGFRRRNLPSLLYKYFADMRKVLIGLRIVMKRGANAFIVVGNNHTIAGGKYVDIPTAKLLIDI